MSANLANILGITRSDIMFKDEKEIMESKLPKIHEIPIELIDPFPNHPFKVRMDDDMYQLVESIKEQGLITPLLLRPKEDGRYGKKSRAESGIPHLLPTTSSTSVI